MTFEESMRKDPTFNPFNDKFDPDQMFKTASDLAKKGQLTFRQLETLKNLPFFNSIYVKAYKKMNELITAAARTFPQNVESLIAIANRDYLMGFQHAMSKFDESISVEQRLVKQNIPLPGQPDASIDANTLLDLTIDVANTGINYFRYFKQITPGRLSNDSDITFVTSLYRLSNFLYTSKHVYEDAVWQNGYIEFISDNHKLITRYNEPAVIIANRVGFIRLQRNDIFAHAVLMHGIGTTPKLQEFLLQSRRPVKLQKTWISQGYIEYELSADLDLSLSLHATSFYSSIATNYPFITDTRLAKLNGMHVMDLFALFSEVQSLVEKVSTHVSNVDKAIISAQDQVDFTFKIRFASLVAYLEAKTNFHRSNITSFLSVLIYDLNNDNTRLNLWVTPLLRDADDLILPIGLVANANPYALIDNWYEAGGLSLIERGNHLEVYIRQELQRLLKQHDYGYHLPKRKKFIGTDGKYEEVDLVLNLKTVLLIAEIKCIKYPFDPRDFYNSEKILRNGATQLNRKVSFLLENETLFQQDIGEYSPKEVVRAVITNFPFFSGLIFDDVPVVDIFLLESYFGGGIVGKSSISMEKIEESIQHKYYSNEDEFSANLNAFLRNPKPIENLHKMFARRDEHIFGEFPDTQLYVENYFLRDESVE